MSGCLALEVASQLVSEGDLSLVQRLLWVNNDQEPEILRYLISKLQPRGNRNIFNIQDLVNKFNLRFQNNPNNCLRLFAQLGSIEWVHYFLDHGATNLYSINLAMLYAAREGHTEIMRLMLEKGATNYNGAMKYAASRGHMEIVQMMLSLGGIDYNGSMECAAQRGHMEIVQLMLNRGANNYNASLRRAAMGGQLEIVRLMLERGATNYNAALSYANGPGHMEIVQLIQQWRDTHN